MNGHALAATILSGGGALTAWLVLVPFSGLLLPPWRRARELVDRRRPSKPRSDFSPERAVSSPMMLTSITLTSIELALIAELSHEQAAGHAAVARDVTQRPETRQRAAEVAIAWRERARSLELEARRRSGLPMIPEPAGRATASTYAGPERRAQMRRRRTRRDGPGGSSDDPGGRDRRTGPERRRRDRRRPELALW